MESDEDDSQYDNWSEPLEEQGKWVIGLCEVGDPASCVLSYICSPCALAYARSNLDDSSCMFNLICMPICCMPVSRWLLRTAYDIEPAQGIEAMDCVESAFLPCCVVNQMFQTSAQYGNTSHGGGYFSNVRDFNLTCGTCKDEIVSDFDGCGVCATNYVGHTSLCMYSFICCPCAISEIMDISMGMPSYYGCCCVTPCAARNLIRYHYRVRGDDILEEMCVPIVASLALWAGTTSVLAPIPVLGLMLPEAYTEAKFRGKTRINKYLTYGGHETFVPYDNYNATAYNPEEEFLLGSQSRDDMTVNSELEAMSAADCSLSVVSKASSNTKMDVREGNKVPGNIKEGSSSSKGIDDLSHGQPRARRTRKIQPRHLPRANSVMLARHGDLNIPSAETSYDVKQPKYHSERHGLTGSGRDEKASKKPHQAEERSLATAA